MYYHMTGCKPSFLLVIERVTLLMSPSNHDGERHYKKRLPPSKREGEITKNVSLQIGKRDTLLKMASEGERDFTKIVSLQVRERERFSFQMNGGRHYKKCLPPSKEEGDITRNVTLQVGERESLQKLSPSKSGRGRHYKKCLPPSGGDGDITKNVSLTKKCVTQRKHKNNFKIKTNYTIRSIVIR